MELEKDINSGKVLYFIFDFDEVTYIDSAAIGLVLMIGKYNDKKGRPIYIKHANETVKRTVESAGVDIIEFQN